MLYTFQFLRITVPSSLYVYERIVLGCRCGVRGREKKMDLDSTRFPTPIVIVSSPVRHPKRNLCVYEIATQIRPILPQTMFPNMRDRITLLFSSFRLFFFSFRVRLGFSFAFASSSCCQSFSNVSLCQRSETKEKS